MSGYNVSAIKSSSPLILKPPASITWTLSWWAFPCGQSRARCLFAGGPRLPGAPDQISLATAIEALRPVLENPKIAKVGQNLKYDMSVLARYGVAIEGPIHDTMLQSYVLNSVATRHNMDALASYYLDRKTIHFEDVAGKGAKQLTFNQVPLETAGDYAAEDADVTLQLHHCLYPQLQAQPSLSRSL